ncbi:MAG: hypothetical protein UZ09_BCD002000975 [Bacteroidetes bacterium OLB9]|nr:MAG: hypothetical protein UZ09_BCD002000975 [Bacteroidetes bacterium OLB9]
MDKFNNKYRIASTRLQHWDYGWNAAYFVTICTKNRICWFGNVADGRMVLSEIGEIAQKCWIEIVEHFPFVKLDAFIVMPNHVHGIIIIDKIDDERNDGQNVETQYFASPHMVSQMTPHMTPTELNKPQNQFGPQSKNLASIIRGFKIGVTKNARIIQPDFAWQSRFHDHIIRDEQSYHTISKYIINNPLKWKEDTFHQMNQKKS